MKYSFCIAEIASVIAPYQATGPEQLSLQVGQLISVRKKNPSGWWEGELHARGQKRKIGWFPANYVTLLSSGSRATPSENRKSLSPTPYTVCSYIFSVLSLALLNQCEKHNSILCIHRYRNIYLDNSLQ